MVILGIFSLNILGDNCLLLQTMPRVKLHRFSRKRPWVQVSEYNVYNLSNICSEFKALIFSFLCKASPFWQDTGFSPDNGTSLECWIKLKSGLCAGQPRSTLLFTTIHVSKEQSKIYLRICLKFFCIELFTNRHGLKAEFSQYYVSLCTHLTMYGMYNVPYEITPAHFYVS